jgi:hypothetical protein
MFGLSLSNDLLVDTLRVDEIGIFLLNIFVVGLMLAIVKLLLLIYY